ncbi:period circadian protein isoform X2 [Pieris rapae]|uniref:period circadian protein isoform X2 n=1 Tax=Pieris rapae TaxID=64459 RepID=UPI001E28162B|nr:period circadian protein isoform X2 [Pieris rapae]
MAFNMMKASENNINKNMGNIDDSENNAKISDSAYSNSCSNSQARSRSSHSTLSGSHSSGSSGYGGKPSTSGYSSNNVSQIQPPEIRCKVKKKKKQQEVDNTVIQEEKQAAPEPEPEIKQIEEKENDDTSSPAVPQKDVLQVEISDTPTTERNNSKEKKEKTSTCNIPIQTPIKTLLVNSDGFSCVISMQDGVVMYTTNSLTNTLGFPSDMWIGRSFIDFVHPRDRNTFASQITNSVAMPEILNGSHNKTSIKLSFCKGSTLSTMVCRIRKYRGLGGGYGVKNKMVSFLPFLLKLSFRNITDEEGEVIYLLLQATPFFPAFKVPNEIISKPIPFIIRHAANGNITYIDPESVPYLGYSPQDMLNMDALHLYHPHDLAYLRQVYETIVKEGGVLRSKPYRMMTQNGDYVKLQTAWSSFINPWSRKLEFVIGKHMLIEGPTNPDVFQCTEKSMKLTEEEKKIAQTMRESIIRIMNKILTKPAEAAKQQMSKRCQDLASFMESLMEEAPKNDEDISVDIKEPDIAYYDFSVQEHDSVMLGGISPHRDYQESKSSNETQISYNQLNYSDTLQRYFNSYLVSSECNKHGNFDSGAQQSLSEGKSVGQLSPMDLVDSGDMTSSCDSSAAQLPNTTSDALGSYTNIRLTETALNKHNAIMEKELMKTHREIKLIQKDERKKSSKECRLKKKEHLERCNASFLSTSARISTVESESACLKRSSKQSENANIKQRCDTVKLPRRHKNTDDVLPSTSHTNTIISPQMIPAVNNMSSYCLGIPQQMPLVNPTVTGMVPVCYVPATSQQMSGDGTIHKPNQDTVDQAYAMPCVMYGQPVYSTPLMYSALNPQMQQMQNIQQIQHLQQMQHMHQMQQMQQMQQIQQGFMVQTYDTAAMRNAMLGLPSTNYQEACKLTFPTESKSIPTAVPKKKQEEHIVESKKKGSGATHPSVAVSQVTTNINESKSKTKSEDRIEKTDEESSYSSFYSNFFKSESGSAEDIDLKKRWTGASSSIENAKDAVKTPRRKMEPPWMEQVCVTSELIYQYQMLPKNMNEVLSRDQELLQQIEQPSLVNDQLGQLYIDLQLEGVATKLTLDEGITSSSSSGDENFVGQAKVQVRRRKREYSKLVMIYEEDAPLPPPDQSESSTS